MATFTFSRADLFPVGTSVKAYPRANWPGIWDRTGAPLGSQTSSATVASDGSVTLGSLADGTTYVAYGLVGSSHVYMNFRTPPLAVSAADVTTEAARATAAELALGVLIAQGAFWSVYDGSAYPTKGPEWGAAPTVFDGTPDPGGLKTNGDFWIG